MKKPFALDKEHSKTVAAAKSTSQNNKRPKKEILVLFYNKAMTAQLAIDAITDIIERNGRPIMDNAIDQVMNSEFDAGLVSSAIKYHVKFLGKVLPVFPALTKLSYDAAGGRAPEELNGIGSALTLFVEAANMHDDVIDQTLSKHNRKTAYGKYGKDISILAGDILLVQASLFLSKACEQLPLEKKETVIRLTLKALAKISDSAAKEAHMRRKLDTQPKNYLEVVRLRATVLEIHCMIGGLLGGATESMVSCLGEYGKNYGILGTIADEFMDLFDYQKFTSRLSNETVPLPVLCALQDSSIKNSILPLVSNFELSGKNYEILVKLVMSSAKVKKLVFYTEMLSDKSIRNINKCLNESEARRNLSTLPKILQNLLSNLEEFTSQILE